ncbi:MAG: hypothetical protein B7Z20_06050 [Sphingobium sp. 32-64-5]|nr:MAG: hypothetical protein B7Z20_06050 [Sphingobium sp. 32-64-5]
MRALFIQLADAGGIIARADLDEALALLDKDQRQLVRKAGFTIGVLDIYHHALLKPGAALWRLALSAVKRAKPMLPLPQAGAVLLTLKDREEQMGARHAGYRGFGDAQIRIDMVERIARGGHEAIAKNERYDITSPFIVSLGLTEPLFNHIMRNAGFRPVAPRSAEGEAVEAEAEAAVAAETPAEEVAAGIAQADAETVQDDAAPVADGAADADNVGAGDAVPSSDDVAPAEPATADAGTQAADPVDATAETAAIASGDDELAVAIEAAGQASADEAAEAVAQTPQGANWVFRGRRKARDRHPGGGHEGAPGHRRNDRRDGPREGARRQDKGSGDRERDRSEEGRRRDGPGSGRKGNGPRGDGGAQRPLVHRSEPERPAGGGAFAGLAALLGRDE